MLDQIRTPNPLEKSQIVKTCIYTNCFLPMVSTPLTIGGQHLWTVWGGRVGDHGFCADNALLFIDSCVPLDCHLDVNVNLGIKVVLA